MSKLSPYFGRTTRVKISLLLSDHALTALLVKATVKQNWRELYEASLLEVDRIKLPERLRVALEAIHQRLIQKEETLSWEEHVEIDDALRALVRRGT
jgi:hypothetical protein